MLAVMLSSEKTQSQKDEHELKSGLKNLLKRTEVLSAQELKNQNFGNENHDLIFTLPTFSHLSNGFGEKKK